MAFPETPPEVGIRWHVLIAEWKWSLSVSNQFCSAGNSRISRSHVRSAVLRKNSGSSAVDDPKPACLRIAVPRLVKLLLSRFQSSRMQRQRGGRVATRRSRAAGQPNAAHRSTPITFERHFAAVTLEPGAHQHAVVLAPVKERPGSIAANRTAGVAAVLDSRSTRRRRKCAGRDGKMLAAEPKDYPKEEDRMQSDQIP